LSVSLRYNLGTLTSAATRGDGSVGEDVTENVLTLDIPKTIPIRSEVEIRGEIIMMKADFHELNRQQEMNGEKLFSNSRNAAAGSLRQIDRKITSARKLRFFPYSIVFTTGDVLQSMKVQDYNDGALFAYNGDAAGSVDSDVRSNDTIKFDKQTSVLKALKEFGFDVSDKIFVYRTQAEAYEFYKSLEKQRADLEYDIDGVVYKLNSLELQMKLGASAKFPHHSIAYKFAGEKAETTVLDIVFQVAKTGSITPVAILKPVTIGGVVVSRAMLYYKKGKIASHAALHDEKEENNKNDENYIRIGDRVVVRRSGEVIPQILHPIPKERPPGSVPLAFPTECPSCGSKLAFPSESCCASGGAKCENPNCEAKIIEQILHFVSKHAFNIDGLGEQIVKFLFKVGIVKNPADIFDIEKKSKELLEILGIAKGDKSQLDIFGAEEKNTQLQSIPGCRMLPVGKLCSSINNSKNIRLDKFIYSLGIPMIGRSLAKTMAFFFKSYDELWDCVENKKYNQLLSLWGIDKATVQEIEKFFANEDNVKLVRSLAERVNVLDIETRQNDVLSNKTIVFTGSFSNFSRYEAKELAERYGAKVSSSVSSRTSFVVAGEKATEKKINEARELGVSVISEGDFRKIIEKAAKINL
jgi:DNA ligase (NAD+)